VIVYLPAGGAHRCVANFAAHTVGMADVEDPDDSQRKQSERPPPQLGGSRPEEGAGPELVVRPIDAETPKEEELQAKGATTSATEPELHGLRMASDESAVSTAAESWAAPNEGGQANRSAETAAERGIRKAALKPASPTTAGGGSTPPSSSPTRRVQFEGIPRSEAERRGELSEDNRTCFLGGSSCVLLSIFGGSSADKRRATSASGS